MKATILDKYVCVGININPKLTVVAFVLLWSSGSYLIMCFNYNLSKYFILVEFESVF